MIKLNNKLIVLGASIVASALLTTTAFAAAPSKEAVPAGIYKAKKDALDGGVTYKREKGSYTAYKVNEQSTKGVNFGRAPTPNELKAWDADIMPDGTGLPVGSGTVEEGSELYDKDCAVCHGDKGDGKGNLVLKEKFLGVPNYKDRPITEGSIFHVVTYGLNAMGSHANQLSQEERWQVADYVLKLKAGL